MLSFLNGWMQADDELRNYVANERGKIGVTRRKAGNLGSDAGGGRIVL